MRDFTIRKAEKRDCSQLLKLIQELAVFENAAEEVSIEIEELVEDGFGSNAIYDSFVAEQENRIIGMAIFYEKYSTWKGRSIYLEDLIVTKDMRGKGIGKSLFETVIKEAKNRNSGRMEWQVLDWNQSAIDFYKSYGANLDSEWLNGRLSKIQLDLMQMNNSSESI